MPEVTIKLPPTIGPGGIGPPGGVGVGGIMLTIEEYLAREIAPKYPAAGATPFDACQAATAVLVIEPKYPVEPPEKLKCPVDVR
ncbi:hypothetical protein A2924_01725 [Candidatus Giovannonibacteria bacterium RIFCSPLOWO2_01_FULL_44_16]|uniref:Uncharacterized protein n=1 Tax=Candidatus Giovannonibacteria bacterium RIFCSPLOWO2_01_FULL_44_16 TaxID=1798348 RepID=A0A1F5X594_9BACT|nr:MAG: hypothetical protein A2924_01725 [Candidatus Giovannonibacteria bacterium RIFCSPLOWO2_01_FULL_44_16]